MNLFVHYIPADAETDNAIAAILHRIYSNLDVLDKQTKDSNSAAVVAMRKIYDSLVSSLSKAVAGAKMDTSHTASMYNPIQNHKKKVHTKSNSIEAKTKALAKVNKQKMAYIARHLPKDKKITEALKGFARKNIEALIQLRRYADTVKAEYPELASVLYSYSLLFHTVNNAIR